MVSGVTHECLEQIKAAFCLIDLLFSPLWGVDISWQVMVCPGLFVCPGINLTPHPERELQGVKGLDASQAMADAGADGAGAIPADKSSRGIVQTLPGKDCGVWTDPTV